MTSMGLVVIWAHFFSETDIFQNEFFMPLLAHTNGRPVTSEVPTEN